MPNNIGYHEAATLPTAACTALKGLRDTGGVGPGSRVLINGATGAVGTYAVQIARALGASHVAAVCSERHVDFVESLGADAVIPYQTINYTETEAGGHYDVVFDLHSNHSFADNAGVMVDDGTLVMAGGPDTLFGFIANAISKKFGALFCSQSAAMFVADAEAGLLGDVTGEEAVTTQCVAFALPCGSQLGSSSCLPNIAHSPPPLFFPLLIRNGRGRSRGSARQPRLWARRGR